MQSIVYKLSRSEHLQDWLSKEELIVALEPMADDQYVDNWAPFNDSHPFLVDYSQAKDGITRDNFVAEFYPLIHICTRHSMGEAVRVHTPWGRGRGTPWGRGRDAHHHGEGGGTLTTM